MSLTGLHLDREPTDDKMPVRLLDLSDEVLVLICSFLTVDTGLIQARISCTKLHATSYDHFYETLRFKLPEEVNDEWKRMQFMPDGITRTKEIAILNKSIAPSGIPYENTVTRPGTYRIFRWELLEEMAMESNREFRDSALVKGVTFRYDVHLTENQLSSFRWRHATPLNIQTLQQILLKQTRSMETLEISMITPPSAAQCTAFSTNLATKGLPKLRSLTYNGLSHTEPIPQNRPERGGRFRMLRPIFRAAYATLDELTLSQDHCISQIGKTPLINGRVFRDWFCNLDELLTHPTDSISESEINLQLTRLELGGFRVAALFDTSSIATAPRIRISLPRLRRLVLNDCDEMAPLLIELTSRANEINLTEVAFRIYEESRKPNRAEYNSLHEVLQSFLTSFKGLQLVSILWDGIHSPCTQTLSAVLPHHSETLEAYSFADRQDPTEFDYTLRFVKQPRPTSPYTEILDKQKPRLREYGLVMPQHMKDIDYQGLRLLSQFHETLRTLHVRNFPALSGARNEFWSIPRTPHINSSALAKAQEFAEMVALPFHEVSINTTENEEKEDQIVKEWKLKELADLHLAERDKILHLSQPMSLSPSKHALSMGQITRQIMQQRAQADPDFQALWKRVQSKAKSSGSDNVEIESYKQKIRETLGLSPPAEETRPKLKLLIIGEWRYRDQLSLTGPRTYDPAPWAMLPDQAASIQANAIAEAMALDSDIDEDDIDFDLESSLGMATTTGRPRLQTRFRCEFDTSILPIFLKIDWKIEYNKNTKRYQWKAKATKLDQNTAEGYEKLSDTRLLDFAWQN